MNLNLPECQNADISGTREGVVEMSDVVNDLRLEIARGLETIWELESEDAVRNHVASINSLIVRRQMPSAVNAERRIPLLEVEDVVREWRDQR